VHLFYHFHNCITMHRFMNVNYNWHLMKICHDGRMLHENDTHSMNDTLPTLITCHKTTDSFQSQAPPLNNSIYKSCQKYCQIYQCSLYMPTCSTKPHPLIRHAHNFFKKKCMEMVCMAFECIKYIDISPICDNSVTTQNVWFFRRDF